MPKSRVKRIAMVAGFEKPSVGDVVAVEAVDWGMINEQVEVTSIAHRVVRGTIYGRIIICTDEQITVAPQVFDDGSVRCALTMPWPTVQQVTILERAK